VEKGGERKRGKRIFSVATMVGEKEASTHHVGGGKEKNHSCKVRGPNPRGRGKEERVHLVYYIKNRCYNQLGETPARRMIKSEGKGGRR